MNDMKEFTHHFLDRVYIFEYLSSTMEKAREIMERDEKAGNFLVISEKQGRGEGRNKAAWYSPRGGLWFTVAIYGFSLKPNFTLFLGIQILKAIKALPGETPDIKIKWPNDLYMQDRKIAGIIVKHFPAKNYYLAGIGINTNIAEFPSYLADKANSIASITGSEISDNELLSGIIDNISENMPGYMENYRIDEDYYSRHDYLLGKNLGIKTEFAQYKGDYMGLNAEGAIILRLANGALQPFYGGELIMPDA
jgi:BirA family transcriptional regulator, biotin operon repressor / biotin---[acetyl-CoA-carboxylase] ligase